MNTFLAWDMGIMALSLGAGILSLLLSGFALLLFGGHYKKQDGSVGNNKSNLTGEKKSDVAFIFGYGSIVIGAIILTIAHTLQNSEE